MNKIVKNTTSGELFIETVWGHSKLWTARLEAWRIDHNQPCPMPEGHLMFKHPKNYGMVEVDAKDVPKMPAREFMKLSVEMRRVLLSEQITTMFENIPDDERMEELHNLD